MEMKNQISSLIELPDTVQRDGLKESAGDCPIRMVTGI